MINKRPEEKAVANVLNECFILVCPYELIGNF